MHLAAFRLLSFLFMSRSGSGQGLFLSDVPTLMHALFMSGVAPESIALQGCNVVGMWFAGSARSKSFGKKIFFPGTIFSHSLSTRPISANTSPCIFPRTFFSMVLPFPSFPFLSFILLTFSIEGRKREIRERKRSHSNGMTKISTSRYYMIIFFLHSRTSFFKIRMVLNYFFVWSVLGTCRIDLFPCPGCVESVSRDRSRK